jgi:gluconokinase
MILVIMGVTGSGKSTIAKLLAHELGWAFLEGDDFHPAANIEKMRRGIPLDDEDRQPWLDAIRRRLDDLTAAGENVVLACSALKHDYQHYLAAHALESVRFVALVGSEQLIRRRLAERKGHFMNAALLHSQFETLDPPKDALCIDIDPPPQAIVSEIRRKLAL